MVGGGGGGGGIYSYPKGDVIKYCWKDLGGRLVVLTSLLKYFMSLYQILSPFLNWEICGTYSVGVIKPLGHSGVVKVPIVFMVNTMWLSRYMIQIYHLQK